jgi:hypothetical protein
LAKFRGLIIMGKYGDVIGKKIPITCMFIPGTYEKASFSTNHGAVFPCDHPNHGISPNDSVNYSG